MHRLWGWRRWCDRPLSPGVVPESVLVDGGGGRTPGEWAYPEKPWMNVTQMNLSPNDQSLKVGNQMQLVLL